ncbi:hypothetical protein Bbelb_061890 [Branchiostoma belcheri]|nr:hypothetical protein Bbelb_061890 [Branchiostoma belcheri]
MKDPEGNSDVMTVPQCSSCGRLFMGGSPLQNRCMFAGHSSQFSPKPHAPLPIGLCLDMAFLCDASRGVGKIIAGALFSLCGIGLQPWYRKWQASILSGCQWWNAAVTNYAMFNWASRIPSGSC